MVREPNIVSIIDADYYGNITNEGHIFINLKNEGNAYFQCKDGMGYVQGIIQPYLKVDGDNVETIRTGGFGSTTKQKEEKNNE
jgi:dUTP pyrophosphatase